MNSRHANLFFVVVLCGMVAHATETPLKVQSSSGPLLVLMTNAQMGVTWTNSVPPARYTERQNLMNGGGVALGDFDGDGRCDFFLCGRVGPSALYRNLGNWRFEEVAGKAGVDCVNQITTGAAFADYDGDGWLDLFVSSFQGPNACFRNLGNGRFADVTETVGLKGQGGATSVALADLDGDGDLDLYLCYFGVEALLRDGVSFSTRRVGGRTIVTGRYGRRLSIVDGRITELGEPDMLYRNEGGRFTALKWEDFFVDEEGKPASSPPDFGLAVQLRDIDLDGDVDIYTCSDFQTPDRLWLNDGSGRFRAIAPLALRSRSYASMGVDFADIDRDGDLDFMTVEMLSREPQRALRQFSPMSPVARRIGEISRREDIARNGFYVNRGDGTYAELAWLAGVAATDWSWTPIFLDVDLDGYEDLLVSNGHLHDVNDRDWAARTLAMAHETKREMLSQSPRLDPAKVALRNRGDRTFEQVSDGWGFNSRLIVHGMALGDLDGDGDLDVVGNAVNAGPVIYQNNSGAPRISVRLRGKPPNTRGIGARIHVRGAGLDQMQQILAGGRYLSGDDTVRVFAAPRQPEKAALMQIEVFWPSGRRSRVDGAQPNMSYEIEEPEEGPTSSAAPGQSPKALFEDVSGLLNHSHHEEPFDDFQRQPLLPQRYSQLGPGLAWFDLDGDGRDELIAGAGRGDGVAILHPSGKGEKFQVQNSTPLPDDSTTLVGTFLQGEPLLLVGQSRYESGKAGSPVRFFHGGNWAADSLKPLEKNSSPGAMAVADIDGDGDLDLFVAGRIIPGAYPEAPASALYRLEGNRFIRDDAASDLIQAAGMITAAVFSDLDLDGFAELITAEEWGPVRIYKNEHGRFTRRIDPGWPPGFWNSVTTGDLNGDGRIDIVAGNIGRNNRIVRGARTGHWLLFYDFDPAVQGELIEASVQGKLILGRDLKTLSSAIPGLGALFPTHKAFAEANMEQALAQYWSRAKSVMAALGDSCVFWNEGPNGWRPQPLPEEAQWAPAFGLNVADFDNDRREDLFIAQNFFAVRPEDDRLDAGRGLLLKGLADGALQAIPAEESGLRIYGEQRGSAVCDFDLDGRLDLAVAQNGAETKLFRNGGGPSGLRVRLRGPAGNPLGYGAVLRPRWDWQPGPAREIHAGSGYWSQDSAVQVFAPNVTEISILWPGGRRTVSAIPGGAGEVEIDSEGTIQSH